jgi:hypothetical protein
VKPEFGTDSMILRWRPDDTRNWNLGYITTAGKVFTDILGAQAYEAGLLDAQKRYVENLAALVPGTVTKPSEKQGAWGAYNDDGVITIDTMLADELRENGWLDAIAEFQRTVTKRLQGDPTEPKITNKSAMPREVVLEVGAEGGSVKLVRERKADGNWQFQIKTDETTLRDVLSEGDQNGIEFSSQTGYVHSFEEALRLLDKYRWFKLYPLEIHPEFLDAVLVQVKMRGGDAAEARWREKLQNR